MACMRLLAVLWLGMVMSVVHAQPLSIQVLDAVAKGSPVAEAQVQLQRGTNLVAGATDAQGRVVLDVPGDAGGLLIRKPGYADLRTQCPCQGLVYALSPVMDKPSSLRVVLTWDAPGEDLDARLIYSRKALSFVASQGPGARLERTSDDHQGAETITIDELLPGEAYLYAVHDFTHGNHPESLHLGRSRAQVFVYRGASLIRSYRVPEQRQGNLWAVFRLNADGQMEDIDRVAQTSSEPNGTYSDLNSLLEQMRTSDQQVPADMGPAEAKALNRKGEEAYRKGDFGGAGIYYREAIEMAPGFAQAYSNLALSQRKNSRPDEAIRADRQAIALASGPAAATIRASAYYDMGRVFEGAGQLAMALENYRKAREQKASPVYDQAIERLQKP
ncbi:MAG: tetratricopeptide repeat protein [Pseudomonas piscis]|uniref:tetratricopeptide repeat protein n=1 Tax=Pseudomonas piscis TaxID=2614538 RepID=UPI003D28EA61